MGEHTLPGRVCAPEDVRDAIPGFGGLGFAG
jgi:hypothetical protein